MSRHLKSLLILMKKSRMLARRLRIHPTIPTPIRMLVITSLHSKVKREIIICSLLLGAAYFFPEMGSIAVKISPTIKTHESDLFICPWYHRMQYDYWYWADTGDHLKDIIKSYLLTKFMFKYSTKLFLVGFVFFLYSLLDLLFYWWNFCTWVYAYWLILGYVYVLVDGIINPYKPDRFARIKSLF
jgi:hypothetical protein